ncbi:hypothetical protein E3N88_45718 [Mikania micrantha]|uniref:Uncharacterized protein n=1 Tax=Mikania micrantha TaxID=192012 RepID=A0A5N6L8J2_9ASTR|nr:hypothetical protein E3N88_45718 [Mikania micrantha]
MLKKHEQGKFNEKVEEGYFLWYSAPNKRVYNILTHNVEEWYNVDVQKYSMPPPGKGPDWMFNFLIYLTLSTCLPFQVLVQAHDDSSDSDDNQSHPDVPEPYVDNIVSALEDLNLNNLDPQVEVPAHPVGRINRIHPQDNIIGNPTDGM